MNSIESAIMLSPYNKDEECAKFVIDDTTDMFVLPSLMLVDREYTFSCWIQSVDVGSIEVNGATFETAAEWTYETHTFTADTTDVQLTFPTAGTYYIYHPQLEVGNHATDWTPSPEDVDDSIVDATDEVRAEMSEQLATISLQSDQIIQTVRNEYVSMDDFDSYKSDVSEMVQTSEDATLSFTRTEIEAVRDENGVVKSEIEEINKYFQFNTNGLTIGSGNADDPSKVVIDNDEISIVVYDEPVQQFLVTGEAKIPKAKITKSMWLLGYLIEEDENGFVNCEYVGEETTETETGTETETESGEE